MKQMSDLGRCPRHVYSLQFRRRSAPLRFAYSRSGGNTPWWNIQNTDFKETHLNKPFSWKWRRLTTKKLLLSDDTWTELVLPATRSCYALSAHRVATISRSNIKIKIPGSFLCFLFYWLFGPQYEGCKFLRNVSARLPDCTVWHPRT
jgi:hypothetical protein